jgi:exosome complex component RRP42
MGSLQDGCISIGGFIGKYTSTYVLPLFFICLFLAILTKLQILLLSPPLSYPLPLLSLTTHLALLSTRLPRLKSEQDEDPLFDDDWDASVYLFPRHSDDKSNINSRPPITLLVISVGPNIIFDPSAAELAVAEVVLAVSVGEFSDASKQASKTDTSAMEIDSKPDRDIRLLSVRTIDPPSRLTPPGVPNFLNTATGGVAPASESESNQQKEAETEGVWQPRRGGAKRKVIAAMIKKVLETGGVAEEVLDGLEGVELG